MTKIDFTEIPSGHDFENFASLFLKKCGFQVVVQPAIGPDGGRDFICQERNILGGQGFKWLVSCKHFAGSGRTVGQSQDEANVNKLIEFQCHGFMFFYSTPHTQSLAISVENICRTTGAKSYFFGPGEITQKLIANPSFYPLLRQFFPKSHELLVGAIRQDVVCCAGGYAETRYAAYAVYTRNPVTYTVYVELFCEACLNYHLERLAEAGHEYGYTKVRDEVTSRET